MIQELKQIDYALFHFINHTITNRFFDFILPILRNANTWIPLYILLVIYCIIKYKKEFWIYVTYILIAFAISDVMVHELIKPWIGRVRPCHNEFIHARLLLGNCGEKWSFPSSHASNHMAIALSILLAKIFDKRWINFLWIFWALIIGFAQIYVGVHFPSDIAGGYLFGISIALFNYRILLPLIKKLHIKFSGS